MNTEQQNLNNLLTVYPVYQKGSAYMCTSSVAISD